jgi:hypothetical protein
MSTVTSRRLWPSYYNLHPVVPLPLMAASSQAGSNNGRHRKTHKKSRNGCAQCKKRHYKVSPFPSSGPFNAANYTAHMSTSALHKLLSSLCFQCDEIYPTCSSCKRLNSSCSLSAAEPPTDSEVVEKQLNIEDLQLLHDWHMGSDTRFSDHAAEESFRQHRGREIDLGFKHPYGEFAMVENRRYNKYLRHRLPGGIEN